MYIAKVGHKLWLFLQLFKKLAKVSNPPMFKNSPNLVTLLSKRLTAR
jgi:hypothetical protein